MALPSNRDDFKAKCLRRLGQGVGLKINVDDETVEDRIDDALQYWRDYHYSGSERQYLAHQITQKDKDNKYLELDDQYFGVVQVFPMSTALGSSNLFSLSYQFAQSDFLSSALTGSLIPYWMAMTHVELVQQVLIGRQPIRFNEHRKQLYIDMDWDRVAVGEFVVVECFETVDPNEFPDVWSDRWLLRYATALIKRQWGENLKKYEGFRRPDGLTFSGQQMWNEAVAEISELEHEMLTSYSLPNIDFWG